MVSSSGLIINRPSVIFDTQGDETIVINLETGHYYRLDGASTRVWTHFEQGVTPDALVAASDNPQVFELEIARIIDELVAGGLLRPVNGHEPIASELSTWTFGGFKLEQFTDLEDILGLDPIHEVDTERGWPFVVEG